MRRATFDHNNGPWWTQVAERAGHTLFRHRDALAPTALVATMILTRRQDFIAATDFDGWCDALGIAAVAVGLVLRLWVMASSGIRRSGVRKSVVAPTLYADGPYAWCRNPLYLGNGIILIGLAAIFNSRWMVLGALPICLLAIRSIVAAEERVLAESFGARYRRYCAQVPRFLPRRLSRLDGPVPNWLRAVRKEHGTIFAATSTAIILLSAKHLARLGSLGHRRGPVLLITWLCLTAAWATVRHLKRTGRLSDDPHAGMLRRESTGDVAA